MTDRLRASVVIPAHNEAPVIGRCLAALAASSVADAIEVVVAANGCTDDTVRVAEAHAPQLPHLRVLELAESSKANALNAGDESATTFPRVYLDADIEVGTGVLERLITALEGEAPLVAAPQVEFDVTGASSLVRAFYRAYEHTPYVQTGLIGLGVYAVNDSGRGRFAGFPSLMADDLFVQLHFRPDERVLVDGSFTVRTPRTVRDLVRVRTRVARGNADLATSSVTSTTHVDPAPAGGTVRALARTAARRPSLAVPAMVYVGVVLVARLLGRRARADTWQRDQSTRVSESHGDDQDALEVAYLVSQYPAPSHTFVEREILALEALGVVVHRFSVRSTPAGDLLSDVMRSEADKTHVLQGDPRAVATAGVRLAVRHPSALVRGLTRSLRTGEATPKGRVWQAFYLAEAIALREAMLRRGVRHVHTHFANNSADIARAAVGLGEQLDEQDSWSWSFSMHGPTEFENVDRHDLPAKVASARGVACISDFARSQLMRLSEPDAWSKLSVVPMSVDTDKFVPVPRLRPAGTPLRVLFVGRLVPEKGPSVLLDALRAVMEVGLDVHARIVGDGPMRASTEEWVASHGLRSQIEVLGALGQDAVHDLYGWADVFVLPSFQEGLPVVLMEAMSTGLPVVTTTIAGIPELVVPERTGVLVPPGRPEAVAEAVLRLSRDPQLRERLGAEGRKLVVARHSLPVAGNAQLDFLRRTTANSEPGSGPNKSLPI